MRQRFGGARGWDMVTPSCRKSHFLATDNEVVD